MRDSAYVATMDWQQLVSLAIVAATAGMFIRVRFFRPKAMLLPGCSCSGCGSGSAAGGQRPQYSVIYHARKGRRPEVLVKMS